MKIRNTLMAVLMSVTVAAFGAPKAAPADAGKPAVSLPKGPPEKLSDLYRVFTLALREGLGAEVQAWPVRVVGRSWELMRDAVFPEVELSLKPFATQGLNFEKGEFFFKKMTVDRDELLNWRIKLKEVREVETRLVFSMRSLAQKLSAQLGQEITLKADAEAQTVLLTQRGRFLFIPCGIESSCELAWDDSAKQLTLKPTVARYGGHRVWSWLWWLGTRPAPQAPVLDLGFSWVPFNIQEVHVSWDRVNLTTNW